MTAQMPAPELEPQVRTEQIRLLLLGMRSCLVPGLLLAALLTWALWPTAGQRALALWCAAVMFGRVLNVGFAEWWRRRELAPRHNARLSAALVGLNLYEGLAWGALPWIALDTATSAGSVLIVACMAGIIGNALSLLASLRRVFFVFSGALLCLVLGKLWSLNDPAYNALAMAGVLYIAGMAGWAQAANRSARAAILLRFENLDLVRRLQVEWEKAQAAQRQAEQANLAKSRFLAAASHDLRQPIHAQGLFLEVLARNAPSPAQRPVLDNAIAANRASAEMLDTLLDFSRIEAGVIRPRPCAFALQPLLYQLEAELAPQADAKAIVYRSRDTRLAVHSDPALLELMLRNLIANAIRYTERGGVLVGCRRRGGQVLVEVYDTGIGIPRDQQQAVFREFHQLGNPERDRRKGLGLGLAITEGLARSLGHRLELHSEPGKGSRFRVYLPLAEGDAPAASPHAERPAGDERLAGRRVLVIDDDPAVREGTLRLLEGWGCRCSGAESLGDALSRAIDEEPDLILSDYRLRDRQTGAEVIAALRQALGRPVPALIVTGDTAPQRLREAASSGVPLLHKPVAPERLYRALVDALR